MGKLVCPCGVRQVARKREDAVLVLAGPPDERYPELACLIHESGMDGRVKMTGFLSQDELVELYNEAALLVLPSFYEGFGLPILEAFACGTPVVASRAASIPELVEDAGVLLDPKDTQRWVDEICRLLEDEVRRNSLIQRGYERLRAFSWPEAAKNILKMYEGLCG